MRIGYDGITAHEVYTPSPDSGVASPDILALYDGTEHVCQLSQRNSRQLVALDTRNVAVTDGIFNKNNLVPLLHSLTSSGGDADVSHVTSQGDLLNAPRLKSVVERSLLKRARELLPDCLLAVLRINQSWTKITCFDKSYLRGDVAELVCQLSPRSKDRGALRCLVHNVDDLAVGRTVLFKQACNSFPTRLGVCDLQLPFCVLVLRINDDERRIGSRSCPGADTEKVAE